MMTIANNNPPKNTPKATPIETATSIPVDESINGIIYNSGASHFN